MKITHQGWTINNISYYYYKPDPKWNEKQKWKKKWKTKNGFLINLYIKQSYAIQEFLSICFLYKWNILKKLIRKTKKYYF